MPRHRKNREPDRFPLEEYGRAVGGPLVVGMVDWMFDRMRQNPPEQILFLARDGQIVKKVWERRVPADLATIPTQYLLASRRALRVAALRSLDTGALDFLTDTPRGLTFADLLRRVGVTPPPHSIPLPKGERRWRRERLSPAERPRVEALLRRFEAPVLARAQEERDAYLAYLRETVAEPRAHVALVDIGWHGTLQRALGDLLADDRELSARVDGYYLGLFAAAAEVRNPGHSLTGFLLHDGKPSRREAEMRRFLELLELFFTSPDPSLLFFRRNGTGRAEPVYALDERSSGEIRGLREIRAGILHFAENHPEPVTADAAYAAARRLGLAPTRAEAAAFGGFRLPRGFGEAAPLRPLAAPGSAAANLLHWPGFVRRFKDALWRAGFWARLSAPERCLLSILSPAGTRPLRVHRPSGTPGE